MNEPYMETIHRIWNGHGERIEVREDRDGLDLTEIVFVSDDGKEGVPILVNDDTLALLIRALQARRDRQEP